jgi:hypothetical protein
MPKVGGNSYQFGHISAGERIRSYRGFLLARKNDGRTFVKWQIKANPWLPRTFLWSGDDRGLEAYIEALINQDSQATEAAERESLATGHVYPTQEEINAQGPMIEISPERLLAVMLGVDRLCVPAAGVLTVKKHGHRYWAGNIQAMLVAKGILPAPTKEEIRQAAMLPTYPPKAHSGINLTYGPEEAVNDRFNMQKTPRNHRSQEVKILHRKHRYYTETISLAAETPPYYIRRLHRGKDLIYLATSWRPKGPWEVLHKDDARCQIVRLAEESVA